MVAQKKSTNGYSAWLRARRQQQPRPSATSAVQVGDWLLTDEDGDLVVVNRATGARTVLMRAGEVS